MHTSEVFVGGRWRPPASGETYATINPATEEVSAQVAKGDERDVDLAVQAARRAFDQGPWPRMAAAERARVLWKLANLITANLDEMARLETFWKTSCISGSIATTCAARACLPAVASRTSRTRAWSGCNASNATGALGDPLATG